MKQLAADLAAAFRRLRRAPLFALLAAGVLALGVGATTALFALVRGVVLRPLPYPEPERLVVLLEDPTAANAKNWPTSVGRLADYNSGTSAFAGGLAATRVADAVLVVGGAAERIAGARATGNLFDVLGVAAQHGRLLTASDAFPEAPPVVVLGDGLWRRRFGADPALVGTSLTLDGVARTVVGIAPPGFAWPRADSELWVPFVATASEQNRAWFALRAVGRLAPSATIAAASAELTAVAMALDQSWPDTEKGTRPYLVPLLDDLLGNTRSNLWLLQGAVLLLLVVATANFASLLLARTVVREGELALRSALGGGRAALVRLQLAEGVALGLLGALLGLALGAVALRVALAAAGEALPRAAEVGLDPVVIAVCLFAAVAAGALGAVSPALLASSVAPAAALRGAGKGTGFVRRRSLLSALVVLEIAAATAIAAGGALLGSSLSRLAALDPGVATAGVVTLEIGQPAGANVADSARYLRRLIERARETHGLDQVSAISRLPVVGAAASTGYEIEGRPNPPGQAPVADLRYAEPGALPLLGVPLVGGRDVGEHDLELAPKVVLVNRAFAALQFPDEEAVGRRIFIGNERGQWRTIVGVVGDVHLAELERPVEPAIWLPFAQATFPGAVRVSSVIAKSALPPAEALRRLTASIAGFDALQAPTKPRSLSDALRGSLAPRRFQAGLFVAFAALAALLAATGVYGITAQAVAQRRPELGLRLALGANAGLLARLVVGQAARLGALGVAAGLLGALAASRLFSALLFGVRSWEPSVLSAVALLVGLTALTASLAPALRASRTAPARALRDV